MGRFKPLPCDGLLRLSHQRFACVFHANFHEEGDIMLVFFPINVAGQTHEMRCRNRQARFFKGFPDGARFNTFTKL